MTKTDLIKIRNWFRKHLLYWHMAACLTFCAAAGAGMTHDGYLDGGNTVTANQHFKDWKKKHTEKLWFYEVDKSEYNDAWDDYVWDKSHGYKTKVPKEPKNPVPKFHTTKHADLFLTLVGMSFVGVWVIWMLSLPVNTALLWVRRRHFDGRKRETKREMRMAEAKALVEQYEKGQL